MPTCSQSLHCYSCTVRGILPSAGLDSFHSWKPNTTNALGVGLPSVNSNRHKQLEDDIQESAQRYRPRYPKAMASCWWCIATEAQSPVAPSKASYSLSRTSPEAARTHQAGSLAW